MHTTHDVATIEYIEKLNAELRATRAALEAAEQTIAEKNAELAEAETLATGMAEQVKRLEAERDEAREQRNKAQMDWDEQHAEALGMHGMRDAARAEAETLKARVAHVRSLIDRDRTGLAATLNKIVDHVSAHTWLLEGRGSYEWDDDKYREEAGHAMRPVIEIARAGLNESGKRANEAFHATDTDVARWLEDKLEEAETKARLEAVRCCVMHVRGENCFQPMLERALAPTTPHGGEAEARPAAACAMCGGNRQLLRPYGHGPTAVPCPDCGDGRRR